MTQPVVAIACLGAAVWGGVAFGIRPDPLLAPILYGLQWGVFGVTMAGLLSLGQKRPSPLATETESETDRTERLVR